MPSERDIWWLGPSSYVSKHWTIPHISISDLNLRRFCSTENWSSWIRSSCDHKLVQFFIFILNHELMELYSKLGLFRIHWASKPSGWWHSSTYMYTGEAAIRSSHKSWPQLPLLGQKDNQYSYSIQPTCDATLQRKGFCCCCLAFKVEWELVTQGQSKKFFNPQPLREAFIYVLAEFVR